MLLDDDNDHGSLKGGVTGKLHIGAGVGLVNNKLFVLMVQNPKSERKRAR